MRVLSDSDRQHIVKARQIVGILAVKSETDDDLDINVLTRDSNRGKSGESTVVYRVQIRQSSYFDVFYSHHVTHIRVDSGAAGNMIRHLTTKRLLAHIISSGQSVHQADASSQLQVLREKRISFTCDNREFKFEGLIVENQDVAILTGTSFMEANEVAVRLPKRNVILRNGTIYKYSSSASKGSSTAARRWFILHAPIPKTIWPEEFLERKLSDGAQSDAKYTIEPRTDTPNVRRLKPLHVCRRPSICL